MQERTTQSNIEENVGDSGGALIGAIVCILVLILLIIFIKWYLSRKVQPNQSKKLKLGSKLV